MEKGKEIESLKDELEKLREKYQIELEQSRMEFAKTKESIVSISKIKRKILPTLFICQYELFHQTLPVSSFTLISITDQRFPNQA